VLTRDGRYVKDSQHVHFTTAAKGIDARRAACEVLIRAAVLWVVVAGIGYRRAAWLLEQLFHVETSKSTLCRWVEEVADSLPSRDEMIVALNQKQPVSEAHFDELFPRGSPGCVRVLQDEHSRILASEEVDKRDEETVKPFLRHMKALGQELKAFYIDGCLAYYNAIRSVFGPSVAILYDYFHILQNAWWHLWKWIVARRRQIKSNSQHSTTP
jgi:hypothetical protein